MIKFTIKKEEFLNVLQKSTSLLIKKNDSSILQNILLQLHQEILSLTTCNLETEIIIKTPVLHNLQSGEITVSGKKLLNICKGLPQNSIITLEEKTNNKLKITSGNSYFELITLPANIFPNLFSFIKKIDFNICKVKFKKMIRNTQFCMAQNDVRHYLNGMLLEIDKKTIKSVTTDGHRLALSTILLNVVNISLCSVIISKQGILELVRLLTNTSELINVLISNNNFRVCTKEFIFTTKLIDSTFPNYKSILLKQKDIILKINLIILKQALLRVSILSDTQFRGVHFYINKNILKIKSCNEEDEKAEEIIKIHNNTTNTIEFTLNVNYIIDILNVIKSDSILLILKNPISTIQIQDSICSDELFVIMPLKF